MLPAGRQTVRRPAATVGVVSIQPTFTYQLGRGRSVSLGNSTLVDDVHKGGWSSLNFGVNCGQIVPFAGQRDVDDPGRDLVTGAHGLTRVARGLSGVVVPVAKMVASAALQALNRELADHDGARHSP